MRCRHCKKLLTGLTYEATGGQQDGKEIWTAKSYPTVWCPEDPVEHGTHAPELKDLLSTMKKIERSLR